MITYRLHSGSFIDPRDSSDSTGFVDEDGWYDCSPPRTPRHRAAIPQVHPGCPNELECSTTRPNIGLVHDSLEDSTMDHTVYCSSPRPLSDVQSCKLHWACQLKAFSQEADSDHAWEDDSTISSLGSSWSGNETDEDPEREEEEEEEEEERIKEQLLASSLENIMTACSSNKDPLWKPQTDLSTRFDQRLHLRNSKNGPKSSQNQVVDNHRNPLHMITAMTHLFTGFIQGLLPVSWKR